MQAYCSKTCSAGLNFTTSFKRSFSGRQHVTFQPCEERKQKLKNKKLLQWSWTTWQFSNPTQNSSSATAAASSLLSHILIRWGVFTPPYQTPHAHKHICLLFMQPLLFHLHIFCSALYILQQTGPYTSIDLLWITFKLDIFREELAEESEDKINGVSMTLKTVC